MSEFKVTDTTETQNPEAEKFKEIRPESSDSAQDAKSFWDSTFKELSEPTKEYDDNGKLYREGTDLVPNNEYTINGYDYKTADQGRIVSAEGQLHMKNRQGRLTIKDSIEDIGKGDQRPTDDRGHLIGDQFDGSNGLENIVPQDSKINQGIFRAFENQLADEVKSGKNVRVSIEPVYEGDSRRPDALVVTYSIDGEVGMQIFPNQEV